MQAIVYTTYGPPDVLSLTEAAKPAVQDDQVLINVYAAGLNAADWHTMKGEPFLVRLMTGGILKPKYTIPGFDIAGKVVSVGKNVTEFQVGDDVFGDISATGGADLLNMSVHLQLYLSRNRPI